MLNELDPFHESSSQLDVRNLIKRTRQNKTHRNTQYVRQLICLLLPQAVASICDKDNRNHELSLCVHQLLESSLGRWDGGLPSHQDSIDVEQQPKARLQLFERQIQNEGEINPQ